MNLLQILRSSINAIYAKYLKNEDIDNLPIYYIGGSQTLPPPLTPEEEEETLQKISEGHEELRQTLVERNLRLVVYIAKKFENTGIGIEDLISIGTIGLMKGVNTFNSDKKIKLATYASRCIENEILMYIRTSKKQKAEISMNQVIGTDKDGNDMELIDTLVLKEKDAVDNIHDKTVLKQVLDFIDKKLNKREKYIMNKRYGLDGSNSMTQQELADELGISRSYVSRIETKVQKMLKKNIKK